MKKRFSLLVLIVAVILSALIASMITFGVAYRFARSLDGGDSFLVDMEMLKSIDYVYRNNYFGEIDEEALENGLIQGYIYGVGDKYGEYMDVERVEEFTADNSGESVGIGVSVVFNDDEGLLEVVSVVSGSPAEEAGILTGDFIYSVAGEPAYDLGYDGTLSAMLGEEGSIADFSVLRDGEEIAFKIARKLVIQESAVGRMYADGITGIIRIEEFDAATPDQFKDMISQLQSEGAERFVFDVRNNPGGDLESILEILDTLLPEGPIIHIESKDGTETLRESDAEHLEFPMAVLVNENTASAAELFASALKDYEVATLVGKTTYGKGSMQSIIPLIDGSALRITCKMYKPPFSEGYDGVGVVPDIDVDLAEEHKNINLNKLTDDIDTQLIRAIEYLNGN